jgi:benzoate/toluate 1,2-dioxygenase beta subunit
MNAAGNDWLAFYAEDVEFWMPSWDDDDTLTTDPQTKSR